MAYIYKIVNGINGKLYIGKTIDIEARWYKHKYLAKKGENKKHLYNSMRKYGIDNFSIEVIEECSSDIASERESYWINVLNTTDRGIGYNYTFGGEGGDTWTLNPNKAITSKKLSENSKGRVLSQKARDSISKKHKGRVISIEQREKISKTLKSKYASGELTPNPPPHYDRTGEKHTEEAKLKMSLVKKGKTYSEIYGDDIAQEMKEIRSKSWESNRNPNYKEVDKDELYELLKNGYTNSEIAKYFSISYPTVISKCQYYFNKPPSVIRKELG